jgi:hypothetical protein
MDTMSSIEEFKKLLAEAQLQQKKTSESIVEPKIDLSPSITEETVVEKTARYLSGSKTVSENTEAQRWNDPLRRETKDNFVTFKEMNDHYGLFLQRIQQQLSSLGGGGEVLFRNLDDIDRSTIGPNRHLAYNATTKKFFFEDVSAGEVQVQSDWNESNTNSVAFIANKPENLSDFSNDEGFITINDLPTGDGYTTNIANNVISVINLPEETPIGPIEQLSFNLNHTHQEVRLDGTLCWDPDDRTLNLTNPGGVTQKIGQDLYGKIRNVTGSTITKGQSVRFSGASMNGTARLEVAPFLADGSFPSLYAFGVAAQDINDNTDGFVAVWGKVRGIDTTGSSVSETWQIGDILYANPTVAGAFTKVKPTAPNNVVPMAAVLRVDATQGEIFVRPTVEIKKSYGRFARTTDLTGLSANTATAVTFDTTTISNGVTLADAGTSIQVDQSGYYQISVSAQLDTNSNKGVSYMWIRRNGNNVADTTRREAIESSDDIRTFAYTQDISLNANDKVQLMVAVTNSDLRFDAAAATAFAPSTASFIVSVTQVQL